MNVRSSFVHNARKLGRTQMSVTGKWRSKMWTSHSLPHLVIERDKLLMRTTTYIQNLWAR